MTVFVKMFCIAACLLISVQLSALIPLEHSVTLHPISGNHPVVESILMEDIQTALSTLAPGLKIENCTINHGHYFQTRHHKNSLFSSLYQMKQTDTYQLSFVVINQNSDSHIYRTIIPRSELDDSQLRLKKVSNLLKEILQTPAKELNLHTAIFQLVAAVLIVILLSGICSGVEAALFSIPPVRAQQLGNTEKRSAKCLATIRQNLTRPISTIVILNNLSNIVGSIFVGSLAASLFGNQWLGIFSAIMTLLIILFSEIIPKTLGERFNEPIALTFAIPLNTLTNLFHPLIWCIEKITKPLQSKDFHTTNEAEIRLLTRMGLQQGEIEEDESKMIHQVFALNDLKAKDLMTPRIVVACLPDNRTLEHIKDQVLNTHFSRIVVIGESIDKVVGTVLRCDLLTALVAGRHTALVREFCRPPMIVQSSERADHLLIQFQQSKQHLAIVADEFGGVAGIITLEDVLEVITGEIMDEDDEVEDLQKFAREKAGLFAKRK